MHEIANTTALSCYTAAKMYTSTITMLRKRAPIRALIMLRMSTSRLTDDAVYRAAKKRAIVAIQVAMMAANTEATFKSAATAAKKKASPSVAPASKM